MVKLGIFEAGSEAVQGFEAESATVDTFARIVVAMSTVPEYWPIMAEAKIGSVHTTHHAPQSRVTQPSPAASTAYVCVCVCVCVCVIYLPFGSAYTLPLTLCAYTWTVVGQQCVPRYVVYVYGLVGIP